MVRLEYEFDTPAPATNLSIAKIQLKRKVVGQRKESTLAPFPYQGCQIAKFDPFLSLDCAPTPSTLAQSKERKGSNFAIW